MNKRKFFVLILCTIMYGIAEAQPAKHDYALIFLNGKFIDTVFRDGGNWSVQLPASDVKDPELEILVEGMGHINFAQFMIDRKGITDRVTLNGMTLMSWEVYPLPMNEAYI